jgi:UDP-N-acetylmuramate dehydrogenase
MSFVISTNHSLYGLNTFGIRETADALLSLSSAEELPALQKAALPKPLRVIGGGSNVLLTGPVSGTVILNRIKGITVEREDAKQVWLRVGAGEIWHDLVVFAIANGWGGVENLALIPGTVGASPIQNIGAYGVEVKDTIDSVRYWDLEDASFCDLDNAGCRFAYRDSIFKQELKGRIIVCSVVFRLEKEPVLNTAYGAIRDELQEMGQEPNVVSIAQAVMNIRRSKLPDPAVTGNAGSFFKNPVVSIPAFEALQAAHPGIPSFVAPDGVKIPAGWLIEQSGWKGRRVDDAGVHPAQALVLVNYRNATGREILELSACIMEDVEKRFGIRLEREVQIW